MDQWQFLDPWLKTLIHHLEKFPKHPSRDRGRRGFTIAPHIWVCWDISDDPSDEHAQVKRAVELVAFAIRVDKRVWEKLRVVCYQHDADFDFDWHRFHSDDLELHIEADVSEMICLDEYFRPLAAADNDPRPGQLLTDINRYQDPTSVAAYFEAKRRICALDVHGRLGGFQIPLTFTIELKDDDATAEAIAMFERLTRSGVVAIRSQTRDDGPQPVYLLEELKIEPTRSSYSSFLFDAGNGIVVPGVLALGPLKEFGIPITTVVGRAEDDPALLDWMANDRPLNVALAVVWNGELRRVYQACCRLHERLEALTLCFYGASLDLELVATILRDLPRTCPSLRFVEIGYGFTSDLASAMDRALALQPTHESSHVSPIRALVLDRVRVLTHGAVTTLSKWLPRPESFTLSHSSLRSKVMDDACFRLLLEVFSRLECLDIDGLNLTTWDDLLDAYETRGCRVRTLVVWHGPPVSCAPLLQALSCPSMRIARTLNELKIGDIRPDDAQPVSIAAEAMLEKNRFIDYIRLASTHVACKYTMRPRLHRFHREPLPKPNPGPYRVPHGFSKRRATFALHAWSG